MVAFKIFWLSIYWYWIFYLIWFVIAYIFLYFLWRSSILNWFPKVKKIFQFELDDLMLFLVLWVLIWWRLWEVFIYEWSYFSQHLLDIVKVWNWWMSFIWWMLWVLIALIILSIRKKLKLSDFFVMVDSLLIVVPIWIFLWRFWNYLNQELYWLIVPQNFWWLKSWIVKFLKDINLFHVYPHVDSNLRVNTNFISMFFEWFILFVVIFLSSFKQFKSKEITPWKNISLFLIFYSIFRFLIEYLRVDSQSQFIWLFTKSQWLFILFFLFGILFSFVRKKLIQTNR